MRTTTERRLLTFVILTSEPSAKVREAAVSRRWSKISPLLVRRPWNLGPYHEATMIGGRTPTLGASR